MYSIFHNLFRHETCFLEESKYFIVAELLSACERMTFMLEHNSKGFLDPRLNLTQASSDLQYLQYYIILVPTNSRSSKLEGFVFTSNKYEYRPVLDSTKYVSFSLKKPLANFGNLEPDICCSILHRQCFSVCGTSQPQWIVQIYATLSTIRYIYEISPCVANLFVYFSQPP